MMNRECYSGLGEYHEYVRLHDWWTMLYAAAFGVIVRVPMAMILYRQHSNNVLGAKPDTYIGGGILSKIRKFLTHPFNKIADIIEFVSMRSRPAMLFKTRYYSVFHNNKHIFDVKYKNYETIFK